MKSESNFNPTFTDVIWMNDEEKGMCDKRNENQIEILDTGTIFILKYTMLSRILCIQ